MCDGVHKLGLFLTILGYGDSLLDSRARGSPCNDCEAATWGGPCRRADGAESRLDHCDPTPARGRLPSLAAAGDEAAVPGSNGTRKAPPFPPASSVGPRQKSPSRSSGPVNCHRNSLSKTPEGTIVASALPGNPGVSVKSGPTVAECLDRRLACPPVRRMVRSSGKCPIG